MLLRYFVHFFNANENIRFQLYLSSSQQLKKTHFFSTLFLSSRPLISHVLLLLLLSPLLLQLLLLLDPYSKAFTFSLRSTAESLKGRRKRISSNSILWVINMIGGWENYRRIRFYCDSDSGLFYLLEETKKMLTMLLLQVSKVLAC